MVGLVFQQAKASPRGLFSKESIELGVAYSTIVGLAFSASPMRNMNDTVRAFLAYLLRMLFCVCGRVVYALQTKLCFKPHTPKPTCGNIWVLAQVFLTISELKLGKANHEGGRQHVHTPANRHAIGTVTIALENHYSWTEQPKGQFPQTILQPACVLNQMLFRKRCRKYSQKITDFVNHFYRHVDQRSG